MGTAAAMIAPRRGSHIFTETFMRKWIIAALVAAFVVGCKSTDTQSPAPIEEQAPTATAGATGAAGGATTSRAVTSPVGGTPAGPGGGAVPPKGSSGPLSKRVVYFDYDSFVVKDDYRAVVDAHAKFMQANKGSRVALQGHADERGSREYNIALGQKRADSVKKLMQLLGATEIQVETVSFGKEKPRAEGHDETAWAQNRRVEFVYVGE
jgi:peptidoglycan-associated lipoprotein